MDRFDRVLPWTVAVAYAATHLLLLSPSLEDIDSVNFALGLREFDPARHQPHPPGNPFYVALGRLSLFVVGLVSPGMAPIEAEAAALAVWSAIAGGVVLVAMWSLARSLSASRPDGSEPIPGMVSRIAPVLLACAPLFWMTGQRPLSDMTGLAAAMATQALTLRAMVAAGAARRDRAALMTAGAALAAGAALGFRVQTFWLTTPLLLAVVLGTPALRTWRIGLRAAGAWSAGVLCWVVPLVVATGGPRAYLAALDSQAGEDFAFVEMLYARPSLRLAALAAFRTFLMPWGAQPPVDGSGIGADVWLAVVVLGLAAAGALTMLRRERRSGWLLAAAFLPYAAFHLLFQETVTTRYALPVLPAVVFLAARGLGSLPRGGVPAVLLAVAALATVLPASVQYARNPHPAFAAMADVVQRAIVDPPALVTSNLALSRAVTAADLGDVTVRTGTAHLLAIAIAREYWTSDGTGEVWFLAEPRRTDMELLDRETRRDVQRYRWPVASRPELGGVRPTGSDWYRLPPPRWFVGRGWGLTPEQAGRAEVAGEGPHRHPIVAYAARDSRPVRLMIGGRYLGQGDLGPVRASVAVDDRVVDEWTVTAGAPRFLRFVDLPPDLAAGAGRYARVTVAATSARSVPVGMEQFGVAGGDDVLWGFGEGWHEGEYAPTTGRRWRWTSARARLEIRGPARPLRVTLRGESPLRYFDEVPAVTLRAGNEVVGRFEPSSDFDWSIRVPAALVAASGGALDLETSRVWVPAESGPSADRRSLGLRVFSCEVETE
ncbi:MAG: DUF2723 domain-containing protein [Acidimicrobiia bacterium]|nr:DUF2723 domain-containing protein [Acidimicrobiia bacterium]